MFHSWGKSTTKKTILMNINKIQILIIIIAAHSKLTINFIEPV